MSRSFFVFFFHLCALIRIFVANYNQQMNLIQLMRKIAPYVRPYKWLVVATLVLTLIGSLIAQVNAIVLDRTVDAINALVVPEGFEWSKAAHILTVISIR